MGLDYSLKEVVKQILKTKIVYGYVRISRDDGFYAKLDKKDVVKCIEKMGYFDDNKIDFRGLSQEYPNGYYADECYID